MEQQMDITSPMSDEMVDDLLKNFLKTVDDDDDESSPVEQRTDEENGTVTADGLTSGSDAKTNDGFQSSPLLGVRSAGPDDSSLTNGRHHGNSSSLDDDDGSTSPSSNGKGDAVDEHMLWFPSAAVRQVSANTLPGRMLPAGYARDTGARSQQSSSDDSDSSDKRSGHQSGLRSPMQSSGRASHGAPRPGLDVLRSADKVTQQWPPQTSSGPTTHLGSLPKYGSQDWSPAPPAYPTTQVAETTLPASRVPAAPTYQAAQTAITAAETTAMRGRAVSSPSTAAIPPRHATPPTSFVDPRFFAPPTMEKKAMVPPPYAMAGTPPTSMAPSSTPPYAMTLPPPSSHSSPPPTVQPGAPGAAGQAEQTVMLTMSQLAALLQHSAQPQPQQTQQAQPVAFQAPFSQPMYSANMPASTTNPVYVMAAPRSNSTDTAPTWAGAISYAPTTMGMPAPYANAAPNNSINYGRSLPQVYPYMAGPAGATPMTAAQAHNSGSNPVVFSPPSNAPPQYRDPTRGPHVSHTPVPFRQAHTDPNAQPPTKRTAPPLSGGNAGQQGPNETRLPRAPWELPPNRTHTTGDQNGGGGDGQAPSLPARAPAPGQVYAWVHRSGRWQPLVLNIE